MQLNNILFCLKKNNVFKCIKNLATGEIVLQSLILLRRIHELYFILHLFFFVNTRRALTQYLWSHDLMKDECLKAPVKSAASYSLIV